MKPSKTIPLLLLATAALCAFILFLAFRRTVPPAQNAISSQVYVWQRNWSDSVPAAVCAHGGAFDRIVILARQINWEDGQPKLLRIAIDWDSLRGIGVPPMSSRSATRNAGILPASTTPQIGAAIRISAYSGPFDGAAADFLAQTIRDLIAEARQNRIALAEIQLDFDASNAKLPGYRQWLLAARPAAAGIPLVITTLPSWLDAPGFAPLVQAADGFVLQVHGLDKPRTRADPLVLCDPLAARKAIAKAGRVGVPFRVALPTYGYAVAFDDAGKFAAMIAEGAPPDWAQGKTVRYAEAQPAELAALVAELIAAHPPTLQGVIWYRLPIDSDRLNWRWPTLARVMQGQTPAPARLVVQIKHTGNLSDILLTNTGELDSDAPCKITLAWPAATLIATDALGDTQLSKDAGGHTLTLLIPGGFPSRLRPGDSRPIAWLRLSSEQEVSTHVE